MDIKAGLVGAGAVVLLGAGIFGASAWANSDVPPAPVVVEETVAVEKEEAPVVVAPEPEPVVTPEPEPVVVPEPAPAPEVVVPEPVVEPAPAAPAEEPSPALDHGFVVLDPGETPPADAPPGTAFHPPFASD
jgi:outer membrane biosynthesis protein TonB